VSSFGGGGVGGGGGSIGGSSGWGRGAGGSITAHSSSTSLQSMMTADGGEAGSDVGAERWFDTDFSREEDAGGGFSSLRRSDSLWSLYVTRADSSRTSHTRHTRHTRHYTHRWHFTILSLVSPFTLYLGHPPCLC
jgi:hypothetical protein